MFVRHEIVWIQKSGPDSVYWPAVVQEDTPHSKALWVKLWGAERRKKAERDQVVKFLDGLKLSDFQDKELKKAIKEALKWRKEHHSDPSQHLPKIFLGKKDIVSGTESSVIVDSKDWKEDFLDSIEDDKENGGTPKKKKGPKPSLASLINSANSASQAKVLQEVKKTNAKAPADVSEYEKLRQKNIADRAAMFAALKKEFAQFKKDSTPTGNPCVTAKRKALHSGGGGVYGRRSLGPRILYSTRSEPPKTRTRSRLNSEGSSEHSSGQSTPKKRNYFFGLGEDEEFIEPAAKRQRTPRICPERWNHDPNTKIPSPDDITDAMLDNVADYVSEKVYGSSGTTCHQCRQKTLDTKTVCRSGHCAGVRGKNRTL